MNHMTQPKLRLAASLVVSLLTFAVPHSFAAQVTTYQYNDTGLVSAIDGPRTDVQDVTQLAYDDRGHVSSLTNALGQQWQYLDYNPAGYPTRLVDANGIEATLSYEDGHITSLTRAGMTWQYSYDALGQLVSATDPAGLTTTRSYDDAHRLVSVTYPDGGVLAIRYDAAGNVTEQTLTQADGSVVSLQRFTYDELGRLLTAATEQSQQQYQYDLVGNPTVSLDGKSQQAQQQYDALNRLVAYVDRAGNTSRYTYNTHGQLTSLTDANGGATTYQYDSLGQLTSRQSPDTGLTTYQYDEAGNLTEVTDARGKQVHQAFDALNRLVSRQLGSGETITYRYDEAQHGAATGKLTTLSRTGSTLSYRYLDNGRLGQFDRNYSVGSIQSSFRQQYNYDAAGRLQSLSYGDDVTVSYHYGDDGHVNQVTFTAPDIPQGAAASGIQWQADGQLTDLTLGNGLALHREYDSSGQLTSQQWGDTLTQYTYDANGNLVARADDSYGFDELDRLVSEAGSSAATYQYDTVGNRLEKKTSGRYPTYTYEPNSNRLTSVWGLTINLDAAGYPSADPNRLNSGFQWNEQGELQSLLLSGWLGVSYIYNGLSQRVAKYTGSNITLYDYGPQGQLVHMASYKGTQKQSSRYFLWLNQRPLAQIELSYLTSQTTPTLSSLVYLQTDQLDAPYAATDSQGLVVWRWNHDAFGNGSAQKDPDGDRIQVDVPLRFPGQIEDSESGLFYNWHRYYDPSTGRYISSDPLGLLAGVNTYGYVGGNPLGYSDPTGLYPDLSEDISLSVQHGMIQEFVKESHIESPIIMGPAAPMGIGGGSIPKGLRAPSTNSSSCKTATEGAIPSAGGVIRKFEQVGDRVYYRVFSGDSTTGSWLTAVPPRSSAWAQEALALPKSNSANMIQKVLVPDGTLLERSRAIPVPEWGRNRGGAEQFKLLEAIPDENFGSGVPLK